MSRAAGCPLSRPPRWGRASTARSAGHRRRNVLMIRLRKPVVVAPIDDQLVSVVVVGRRDVRAIAALDGDSDARERSNAAPSRTSGRTSFRLGGSRHEAVRNRHSVAWSTSLFGSVASIEHAHPRVIDHRDGLSERVSNVVGVDSRHRIEVVDGQRVSIYRRAGDGIRGVLRYLDRSVPGCFDDIECPSTTLHRVLFGSIVTPRIAPVRDQDRIR